MYFLFQRHMGDENDNHIDDVIVEAPTVDAAWLWVGKAQEAHDGAQLDGDDTYGGCIYSSGDMCTCDDGEKDNDCDADHRTFHDDFYLQSSHGLFADACEARASYHGFCGFAIRVDESGAELDVQDYD